MNVYCSAWRQSLATVAALASLLFCGVIAHGQPGAAAAPLWQADATSTPQYRRVFVPADRPEDWPTGANQFLPINRAEFEHLAEAASERRALSAAGGAQLVSAAYRATLSPEGALTGQGTYEIKLVDDAPSLLDLSRLNLRVAKLRWTGGPGDEGEASDDAEAARVEPLIGRWTNSEGSFTGLLVDRSADLVFDWRAAAATADASASAELEFRLQLPPAPRQTFTLDLPESSRPEISQGRLLTSDEPPNGGPTRWTFALPVTNELRVRIVRTAPADKAGALLPSVAMSEAYAIAATGLEYEAELRIQPPTLEPVELRITAPRSLRVTQILVDRSTADWRYDEPATGAVVAALPPSSTPLSVTIHAVAETVLGQPWKLPRIKPERLFWTEGAATLWIDPALELQSITPRGSELLNLIGVGRPDGGEAYRLQSFTDDSSTEILLQQRTPVLQVDSGVVAEFADRELVGRCRAHIEASGGAVLEVVADLQPQWVVDAVEAVPPDAITQWHVAGEGPERRLHLQLARSPLAPLTVTISARRPLASWTTAPLLESLHWISFPRASGERRLLVTDRRGGELLTDAATQELALDLAETPQSMRNLLGAPPMGLLLDPVGIDRKARIRPAAARASLTAEAWHELSRTRLGFEHRTQLRCRPTAGAISEILLSAARAFPPEAVWTLSGGSQPPVVQRVEAAAGQSTAPGEGAVVYRVAFPQPRSDDFTLTVAWRGGSQSTESINSLVIPTADGWQSWAVLRGDASRVAADGNGRPFTIALPTKQLGAGPAVLGCFRLGDDPAAPATKAPSLRTLARSAGAAPLGVTASFCDVTTLYFADGNQTHRFNYELTVSEAEAVEFKLPPGARLESAQVDGRTVVAARQSGSMRTVRIPLPTGNQAVRLTLDLTSQGPSLPTGSQIAPPLPRRSFPVAHSRWTVAAPAPFLVETDTQRQTSAGWRQRLFGPLARTADAESSAPAGNASQARAEQTAARTAAGTPGLNIPQGWSVTTQLYVVEPEPVSIRRSDDSRAAWHVTWLVAAVASATFWPTRPRAVAILAAAAAMACLVLPAVWLSPPQAMLLGAVAGGLLRLTMYATMQGDRIHLPWPAARAAGLLLALPLLAASRDCQGAETIAPPPPVLYPIDRAGKPTGDDVYAPAELLSSLIPPTASPHGGATAVLLSARGEFELAQAASGDVVSGAASLHFRWRTFVRGATLELPLRRADGDWHAAEHTLNGQPAPLQWSDAGDRCTVVASKPGVYDLVLRVTPRAESTAGVSELTIAMPSFHDTQVQITHPPSLNRLTVNGVDTAGGDQRITSIELPTVHEVRIAWSPQAPAAEDVEVDQLSWLNIDPVIARLQVRLRIRGAAGASPGVLQLLMPPQLKLMSLPLDAPVDVVQRRSAAGTIAELRFRGPVALPLSLALPFELQRSVSVGQLRFPNVRLLNGSSGVRQYAVSLDPRLRLHEDSPEGLTPISAADVEQLWGALPQPTASQYAAATESPQWTMHVEPAPLRSVADESMQLLCRADDVQVEYAAELQSLPAGRLVHRISAPEALQVDAVAVTQGGAPAAAVRWSRPQRDKIWVFLSHPLRDPYTLRISGRMPYSSQRRLQIPGIRLEEGGATLDVEVRRTSDVVVQWPQLQASPTTPSANSPHDNAGLRVGGAAITRGAQIPDLQVSANAPLMEIDALMSIRSTSADALGTLSIHGKVSSGVVDRLQILTDRSWVGPFDAGTSASVAARRRPQDDRRQVVEIQLQRPAAAGEQFTLQVTGKVAPQDDQRIRFPRLKVLDAAEERVFLALPGAPDGQATEWTLRGLELAQLPPELAAAAGADARSTYLVLDEQFVAEQRVFPVALRRPLVRMAFTRAVLGELGRWSAVTELIIQPGGAEELSVQFPDGAELVEAAVDDRVISRPSLQHGVWKLPPGSQYLPRIVTVTFQVPQSVRSSSLALKCPQVLHQGKTVKMEHALWQVQGAHVGHLVTGGRSRRLGEATFETALRRDWLSTALDAAPLAFQLADWEHASWFRPWVRRLGGQADVSGGSDGTQEAAWKRLRQQIGASPAATAETDAVQPTPQLYSSLSGAALFQSDSSAELTLDPAFRGFGAGRWLLAAGLALLTLICWRRPQQVQAAIALARRWPSIAGIVGGLLWWALLSPALLGPAIVALSLAALFKRRQQQQVAEPSISRSTSSAIASSGA